MTDEAGEKSEEEADRAGEGSEQPGDAGEQPGEGVATDGLERDDGGSRANRPHRFDRLPPTANDREVAGRATREAVLAFLEDRYGIPPATFDAISFWERGAGKVWAFCGNLPSPVDVEGLGMAALRTRQEHWKPTLEFAQRFGDRASLNVIHLGDGEARAFLAGHDQALDWDGDWGYLLVSHDLAGAAEPLGVGLYLHGEFRSQVPKGRRRDL
jgi:NOL1/NOP2/fmu family ribosome biogenesis protein